MITYTKRFILMIFSLVNAMITENALAFATVTAYLFFYKNNDKEQLKQSDSTRVIYLFISWRRGTNSRVKNF